MIRWTYACLVIGLVLLAAPVTGQIPDTVTVSTDTQWLTAGSGETATITVQVTNGTPATGVGGIRVELSVGGTDGSIAPANVVTGTDGKATAKFGPGTKSGTATLTATVLHEGLDEPLTASVEQHIDHATPYRLAGLWYDPEVLVGETTDIIVRMEDRYGNPVDVRRVAETVTFMVGSPAGGAFFEGSDSDKVTVPVNVTGNATARLNVDTVAGENIVYIQPPASVGSGRYITITALGNDPARIDLVVDPASASVPADGDKVIRLTYTLRDAYGNSAPGQGLWVNATIQRANGPDEQSVLLYSNRYGQVMVTYGPENSMGTATITATAAANPGVSVTQVVEFTSTDPVDMVLSASPQSMPSRDVDPDSVAQLRAKVMDVKGNPVGGETVRFEIDTGSINHEGVELVGNPYLEGGENITTAVTDENGYATVNFHPGKFKEPDDGKRIAARGNVTVSATWENVTLGRQATRSLVLTWMNYPYLSVETEVSPATIGMNDTVDVTIRLKGDGYELQPDPIDVVLVIDRSGSMGTTEGGQTRMAAAKAAASTFIGQMDADRDRVGLVSFSSSTTVNNNLGDSFESVNTNLNSLTANGATQLRRGIYEAILMQKTNTHDPDAVKAVIVMTDGEWNYDGSPVAHGTGYPQNSSGAYTFSGNTLEPNHYRYYDGLGGTLTKSKGYWICTDGEFTNQNMSRFASDNSVRLYTITFAYSPSTTVNETMKLLATSTGGFYEYAKNGAELTDIYRRIAGELKTEAGVNTTMTVFNNVELNETPVDAFKVFDYRYQNGISTYIHNTSGNGTTLYEATIDQTSNWNTNHNLHFDIGTIHLNQVWEANIRLAVNSSYEGGEYNNINIFGPGASLSFNNGEDTLELPDTFLTVLPDLNDTGITSAWLEVDLYGPELPPGQDSFTDTVPLTWTITYNGTGDIHETLAYSKDDRLSWTVFWTKTVDSSTTEGEALLDASNLPAGDYWVRLTASADDAPDAVDMTGTPITIGSTSRAYIKIE